MAECTPATVDSAPGHRSAPDWCGLISSGVLQDECFFQIAEHTKNPSSCVQAGVFRDDCRLHLWTKQTHTFFVDDRPWNAWVDDIAQAMRDQEIDPKDMRFWSAAFRRPLRPPPMDRRGCLAITNEQIRQACWHTGARVYEDWLNHERDFSALECGVEPPPRLRPIDDPELAGQLNARWGKDLCPRVDSRQ